MAQHDYVIDNNTGLNVRTDINNALAAIVSNNSGATEPTTMFAYMFWADTTTNLLKQRNAANNAWITIGDFTTPNFGALLKSGGTMTGVLVTKNAADVNTPDLTLAGDTDTGWYSPGANLLGFIAGAVELFRLDGVLGYVKMLGTKALQLPSGTTAQRPTGVNGLLRYNSDLGTFEGYANSVWGSLGGYTGYKAVVGSESFCTHANIAAALADANVVAGDKILVVSSETVNTTITVSKANLVFDFMPGVTLTNGTAGTGFTVAAGGTRIKGGRFSGFTTAISISSTFQYNFVTECRFASCTNEVTEVDAAPINVIANNITE